MHHTIVFLLTLLAGINIASTKESLKIWLAKVIKMCMIIRTVRFNPNSFRLLGSIDRTTDKLETVHYLLNESPPDPLIRRDKTTRSVCLSNTQRF